jgi:Glycosyl transferases group 1
VASPARYARRLARLTPAEARQIPGELAWRLRPSPVPPAPPTWPVDPEVAARVTVRWPQPYAWPPAAVWLEPLRRGLSRLVRVEPSAAAAQPYRGIFLAEAVVDGEAHRIAIDFSDYADVNAEALERSAVYFKLQHEPGAALADRVVAGGFVGGNLRLPGFLGHARRLRDERRFEADAYGRFGLAFAGEIRRRAVDLLSSQRRFTYVGGLKPVRYAGYLREIARARICIDLPGNGDLCFRLVDYLAVGSCVIGPPAAARLHVPLVDREHVVHTAPDLSDLVDLCAWYLEHDDEREALALRAREFYDRYLDERQLAGWYLHSIVERLA